MTESGPEPTGGLAGAWRRVVSDLQPNQRAWLRASDPVTLHESTAVIAVPNDFTRMQLEGRLRNQVEDGLSEELGREIRLAVTVNPDLEDDRRRPGHRRGRRDRARRGACRRAGVPGRTRPRGRARARAPAPALALGDPPQPQVRLRDLRHRLLEPVRAGRGVAVAEAPARAYNPLFIYGESGLGKTHLLHAIGNYARNLYPGVRVRYVNSEEFTNDFINSIRDDKAGAFQRRYRNVDFLLIDDIQFLQGKEQTIEEFFHTFNTLHNSEKQVVITSDRAPKRLDNIEDRLRNRFEWGLVTDVQPPDLETRIAILRKKAAIEGMTAPADVLEFIASKIQTNIRELEGALIRVTAFANLNKQPVDLTLAEIVLRDLIPEGAEPEITPGLIIAQTAAYFGVSIDDLTGPSRGRHLVQGRQIAMYLCRELTQLSLPKIGGEFGGRDHTTVMHADRKIRTLLAERRSVFNQVSELTNRIKMQARAN